MWSSENQNQNDIFCLSKYVQKYDFVYFGVVKQTLSIRLNTIL